MMFKFFWPSEEGVANAGGRQLRKLAHLGVVVLLGFAGACQSVPPLRPIDLHEPGWSVREGQAIWKRTRNSPEIAGELLVATNSIGAEFVQFTKEPFPMVIAQRTRETWQIELPLQDKRYTGRGRPPERLIWAYLPSLLAGATPPKGWSWVPLPDNAWRLENSVTGELIEGYFSR
jgi:hypothetical protein